MGMLEDLSSGALNVGVIIIVILLVGGVAIGITYLLLQRRKFSQFNCEIWQKDGFGQFVVKKDQAGIFVDGKTKNKRLFLKKNNVGLTPDNIPFLTQSDGKRKIILLQTGLKNFRFIKPMINDNLIHFTVGEEDVNWAVNAYERQKKLFAQSWLAQYLPFIMLAFVSVIILIMFMQIFKQMPMMLDITKELKNVATVMAQARSGVTVI